MREFSQFTQWKKVIKPPNIQSLSKAGRKLTCTLGRFFPLCTVQRSGNGSCTRSAGTVTAFRMTYCDMLAYPLGACSEYDSNDMHMLTSRCCE